MMSENFRTLVLTWLGLALAGLLTASQSTPVSAADNTSPDNAGMEHDDHGSPGIIVQGTAAETCVEGVASGFPCRNVELLSRLTLDELGGGGGNETWGWKDEANNRYYALMGLTNGVAFVDVTEPEAPVQKGFLPTVGDPSSWRDIKEYGGYAYVVADSNPEQGMQVFDLRRLRDGNPGRVYSADAHYTEFGSAHNIAINADTGFAYVVGSDTCDGGLHMINLAEPLAPDFAGCYAGDGYTHDAHCVSYDGPDEDWRGQELCFASNEDSLSVESVMIKDAPFLVSKLAYPGVAYTHQGWLSDDHRWFILNDEIDELNDGGNARTLVFDVSDVDNPRYVGAHAGANNTIDHNLYLRGRYIFQANYTAGLRILLAEDFGTATMREVAYFDTAPNADQRAFQGAWNVYPFFDNGVVLVSDMQAGLFVLQPNLAASEQSLINGRLSGAYASPMLPDQGMTLTVGENNNGPFIFVAWFLYLDGVPFWLSGAAPFTYPATDVSVPLQRLSGPGFLDMNDGAAAREDVGSLNLHAHSCNAVHLTYDFGDLGAGEVHMESVASVQGRECPPSEHY